MLASSLWVFSFLYCSNNGDYPQTDSDRFRLNWRHFLNRIIKIVTSRQTDRLTCDDMLPQNREEFGEFFLRKKKREFSPEILRQFRHFVILRQKKRVKDWSPLSIQSSHLQKQQLLYPKFVIKYSN